MKLETGTITELRDKEREVVQKRLPPQAEFICPQILEFYPNCPDAPRI